MCSGRLSFSFLEGVNPDAVSIIQAKENVFGMLYSQSSGLIYVVRRSFISGLKWDETKKTFHKQIQFSIKDKIGSSIFSFTLAPQDTFGRDQIYVSMDCDYQTKNVYRLGGPEFEKKVLLPETSYIENESIWWDLASNTDRHILLIYPTFSQFIYIHVEEQKHGKVDLNQLDITDEIFLLQFQLIGQLLILGDVWDDKISLCELIVTESDAFIKSGSERGPIESYKGFFAAVTHILGDEDEQLHLFTITHDKGKKGTHISEYNFNLAASGSDLQQASTQAIQTLKVKGKFHPYFLVNVNTSSPVLIGKNKGLFSSGKLSVVELNKQQVTHQAQQPTKQCIIS